MITAGDALLLLDLLRLRGGPGGASVAEAWRRASANPRLPELLRLEGAELWLYRRLRALNLVTDPALAEVLRAAAHRDALIGLRVDEETEAVIDVLSAAGVPFSLIKGPARRAAAALYPFADARSTSDVDVLVPAARGDEAWAALTTAGYEPVDAAGTPDEHFHLPPLWTARRVAVELHTSTSAHVEPAEAWRRVTDGADAIRWAGRMLSVGSATELLWHGLSHAFMHGGEGVRLRTFLDGAAILASGRTIEWAVVEARIGAREVRNPESDAVVRPRELRRWIATAAMLGGVEVPAEIAADGCYPLAQLLRWRALALGAPVGRAGRGRLLEEAARCEFGLSLTPTLAHQSRLRWARRFVASAAARAVYVGWRAVTPVPA